jgi:hypothetical protein
MDNKKPWQSKTVWASLVVAVAAFFPAVQTVIVANPEITGVVLGGVFGVLRLISKGKISVE